MHYKILNIAIPTILSIFYFFMNGNNKAIMNILSAYFIYSAIFETIGLYLDNNYPDAINVFFYDNIFIPSLYIFVFFIFYKVFKIKLYKQIVVVATLIYVVSYTIDKFIISYNNAELSYVSYSMGAIFCIAMSMLYLYSLINSLGIIHFKSDIMFWFSIGNLLFQIFTFPFFALLDVWYKYSRIGNFYYYFTLYVIYLQYIFYTIGLLCLKRK